MSLHDWRPGDRVASIAVRESIGVTGLGTIQRVILEKAIVLWDDGTQSEERLKDLILAGFNESKVVKESEIVTANGNIIPTTDLISARTKVSNLMLSGLPLTLTSTGINWGS